MFSNMSKFVNASMLVQEESRKRTSKKETKLFTVQLLKHSNISVIIIVNHNMHEDLIFIVKNWFKMNSVHTNNNDTKSRVTSIH